jgi:glycosyltransferase involved in cell wall biosynthesis
MKLSIIILAKNDQNMIRDCLKSVAWADEIIIIDTGSTDKTISIVKKILPDIKIIKADSGSFDYWRNLGKEKAQGDWIFYLDTDERVTKELKQEIKNATSKEKYSVYRMPRENYYFGKRVKYGGSWPDYVTRLFKKDKLIKWKGIIHESPIFNGNLGTLKNPLIHKTHRTMSGCLQKSIEWTKKEAQLFYQANHPPVTWWRVVKVSFVEFFKRAIVLQGFRDGTVGIIEALVQAINRFMVYVYLWEIQNQ